MSTLVVKNCEVNNQPSLWGSAVKSLGTTKGCATLFDWAGKVTEFLAESGKAWAPMKAVSEMSSTGLSGLELPYFVYILDASVGSAKKVIGGNFSFKAISEAVAHTTDALASAVGVVDKILPGVLPSSLVNASENLETASKVAELGVHGHAFAKNRTYINHLSNPLNLVDWQTRPILATPIKDAGNIGRREDYTSPALKSGVEAQNTNILLKLVKTVLSLALKALKIFNVPGLSSRARAAIKLLAASCGLVAEVRANYGTYSNLKFDLRTA